MLACFLDGPGRTIVRDVATPRLSENEILVRMEASGVCGTDLEKINGQLGPGGILGHEVSGSIESVAGTVQGLEPGARVVVHHHAPCYNCPTCLHGDFTMCTEFKQSNIDPCGFAELFRVPSYNIVRGVVIKLPQHLSFEEGAMIEPTACCIRAIRKAHPKPEESVLVVGLGPTGLTQIQILKHETSGKIIGTDIVESRLAAGHKLGASETIDPRSDDVSRVVRRQTTDGVDLAIVSTGNEKALDQAFASVRKGGRILIFGAPAQSATYTLDVSSLFSRQISLISSYSCVEAEMHEAIRLVVEKLIDLKSLITDRFKLRDADRAFIHARTSKAAIKTIVEA
jgi:L-iditol 2-dehydrogenase